MLALQRQRDQSPARPPPTIATSQVIVDLMPVQLA